MFASPVKKSAQCTDVQSQLHSIWEQNDFKTNLLQLSSFTNLSSKLSQRQLDALIKLIAVHVTQSVLANRDKKTQKTPVREDIACYRSVRT